MLAQTLVLALFLLTSLASSRDVAFAEPAASPPGLKLEPATSAQVLAAVRARGAKVTLVNLWATWCVPCRQEFPDLMRFYRDWKDRGVDLVLVSGDFSTETAPATEFLASQGVDFRTYLKSEGDQEFINGFDTQWSGALPATFIYDSKGQRRHSFHGPITYQSLEQQVAPILGAAN